MTPSPAQPQTREKPIIFSAPMIRAILAGRKVCTRRIIKPQPKRGDMVLPKSRIQPGDVLWVKESYCAHWSAHPDAFGGPYEKRITSATVKQDDGGLAHASESNPLFAYYRATFGDKPPMEHLDWVSPIFMPRWASRLTLEVLSVRAERIQDITEAECILEGFVASTENGVRVSPMEKFRALWDELNGWESWNADPWVRRIEFRRIEQ